MTHLITDEDLAWLDDAVGYDNVSTVGAACARLIKLRKRIEEGEVIGVRRPAPQWFDSTEAFDSWVRARYPVFTDDPLHPLFRV